MSLFANVLIAVIFFYLFDIELNLISLAGVAVSFGIMIDTTIVMVDHYSYYRNRSVFIAILAALLTTIGSLVVIFFMPDYVKGTLNDFATIIIINLCVALFVALFFVPAIIDRKCNYSDGHVAFIPLFGIFGAVTALSGGGSFVEPCAIRFCTRPTFYYLCR